MPDRSEFVLGLNPVIRRGDVQTEASTKPLARYLTLALNIPARIVTEADYAALIERMRAGEIDAALLGEYAFYIAQQEAGAEALAVSVESGSDEAATYQSVVVARTDGHIHALDDLRGLAVGFVDPSSTAGYLIPRRMLREAGVDPDADIRPQFFASHSAIAEAVIAGAIDAGALHGVYAARMVAGRSPSDVSLRTIAMSPPIPKGPFAVRRGLDREVRQRLLQALLRIHDDAPEAAQIILSPGTHWRPTSNRHVTLKTVAALSGVSYGTVSRVINGRAHVAPETYARVMSIVDDLGYRPNAAAVSLIANRSDLIGFVVPDATDPALAQYMVGIQRALAEVGAYATLCPVAFDREQEADFLSLLDDGRFGGLILTAWSRETPAVSTLAAAGRALVILGATAGSSPIPAVSVETGAAVDRAMEHLGSLGHVTVGGIAAPALRGALARRTVDVEAHLRVVESDEPEMALSIALALLQQANRPTALICGTERIALGVVRAAAQCGLRIPDDLSVLALGESWLAASVTPPLTTVSIAPDLLGERAAQLLVEQMSGGERQADPDAVPVPVLTERASTVTRRT